MNPYEVLGIKPNATDAEIKTAYRNLVKKYHPDKHQDNPLSELAEEKLREINEAYEMLTNGSYAGNQAYARAGNAQSSYGGNRNASSYNDGYEANPKPGTAEWFYQAGVNSINRGWYDDGVGKLQTAVNMSQNSLRYRDALNHAHNMGNGYRSAANGRGFGSSNDDLCKLMQCMICTDCLCDCI